VATANKKINKEKRRIRLIFQDEARFGRMSSPKSCWAPSPLRPMVSLALVREFNYIYGAISPWDGRLDYMITEKMNTENMNLFLSQVKRAHQRDFVIMVVDGASSHRSKDLKIPKHMTLITLPPYSPELNPAEQIWRMLRTNYFGNRSFNSLEEAVKQVEFGLFELASNKKSLKNLANWPWISDILNA